MVELFGGFILLSVHKPEEIEMHLNYTFFKFLTHMHTRTYIRKYLKYIYRAWCMP